MSLLSSPTRLTVPFCHLTDPQIPPSISQLFRTNSVPSPMDTQRIHYLLEEREAELSAFAEEIERVRAQLHRVERQRDRVQDVVRELQALMSPIRRMPKDIMATIFEHCVWDHPIPSVDSRAAPLLLARVCRSWRHLLFSLPCLWTTLQLNLPSSTQDWEALVQFKTLAMHVWLSRSKPLPVSLLLDHAKGSLIPWHALVHLDKEVLALASRLKDLSLHFSARSLSCLLTFMQTPLPCLEHLELHHINSLPTSENPPPVVLHSAPKLKSLSLCWCNLDLGCFQIPWIQLQHLSLDYNASAYWNPVHSDYLQILACCPNLTTLSLGIGAPINDVDSANIVPVTLPRVHTFKSSVYVQTQYLSHFFAALRMPQLRHFDIKNASLALTSYVGQVECLPLLVRCADTLESVCFDRIDIPDDAILSCLAQLHRLKTLSFLPALIRLNHGFIAALAHGDEGVCPALETLHLRCSLVVPVDAITRLVASRRQMAPKLRQFSLQLVSFDYGLDTRDGTIKQVEAQLKEYVEDGLQLVLTKSKNSP